MATSKHSSAPATPGKSSNQRFLLDTLSEAIEDPDLVGTEDSDPAGKDPSRLVWATLLAGTLPVRAAPAPAASFPPRTLSLPLSASLPQCYSPSR